MSAQSHVLSASNRKAHPKGLGCTAVSVLFQHEPRWRGGRGWRPGGCSGMPFGPQALSDCCSASLVGWRLSPGSLLPTCNLLSKSCTENPGRSHLCPTLPSCLGPRTKTLCCPWTRGLSCTGLSPCEDRVSGGK